MHLGTPEIILIVAVIALIFGIGKLPQVASALGKSIKAFKDGQKDADKDKLEEEKNDTKPVDTTAEVVKNEPVEKAEPTVEVQPSPVTDNDKPADSQPGPISDEK